MVTSCTMILVRCKNVFLINVVKIRIFVQLHCSVFKLADFQSFAGLWPDQSDLLERAEQKVPFNPNYSMIVSN